MGNPRRTLRLTLPGRLVEATVDASTSTGSPVTGRPLDRLDVSFRLDDDDAVDARDLLVATGRDPAALADADGGAWRLGTWSTQDTADGTVFRLELETEEVLRASTVTVDGLDLTPTAYRETFEDGAVVVELRADVTGVLAAFRDAYDKVDGDGRRVFHEVVRHGVDETPRLMRFGRVLWSEDHGETEVLAFLVEQGWDDRQTERMDSLGGEPVLTAAAEEALTAVAGLRALVEELRESGAIPPAAAEAVRTVLEQGPSRHDRWRLYRVGDLDDWASGA